MNNKKETIFCLMFSFESFEHFTTQKKYLIEKISKAFEKFYMINGTRLEIGKKSFSLDIEKIKKEVPKNCKIIDPHSSEEFLNFAKNKKLIIFCNIGRHLRFFRIHYLLKKVNAKLIYAHEIGMNNSIAAKAPRQVIGDYFYRSLPHKIVIILSIFNIFPKIDLRFLAIKKHYDKATNNFLFKISKKFKYLSLFYTRDFKLINSLSHDFFLLNKTKVTEEKIVVVDTSINHHDAVRAGSGVSNDIFNKCYKDMETFLKMLSKTFNKPVTVCIHPTEDIDKIKNLLKDFEIVKYQTKENIYKSFIVLFYNSSAIVDAYLLRKRIIAFENKRMGDSWVDAINVYPSITGIMKIDLQKENKILDKNLFLKKLDETIKSEKYNNFIKGSLESDISGGSGTDKIINTIKKKYFK